MCFCGIGLVTGYDASVVLPPSEARPAGAEEIIQTLKNNADRVKRLVLEMVKDWSTLPPCHLSPTNLRSARI